MEIIWTKFARITFLEISENLQKFWTSEEVLAFHQATDESLSLIRSGKILHPYINSRSQIRKNVIHPNVTLYYKVVETENRLVLLTFFNNRMNPHILRKLLNLE